MLERENLVPVDNPLQQLQLLAAETLRYKEILADKVEELRSWTYENIDNHEDIRAILSAYERALERAQRAMVDMARLGIQERLVRLSEVQAELIKGVIMAVLDSREMGLSRELRQTGRTILARELAAVTSGGDSPGTEVDPGARSNGSTWQSR